MVKQRDSQLWHKVQALFFELPFVLAALDLIWLGHCCHYLDWYCIIHRVLVLKFEFLAMSTFLSSLYERKSYNHSFSLAGPEGSYLVVQNDKDTTVNVNLTILPSNITFKEIELQKHLAKKVQIHRLCHTFFFYAPAVLLMFLRIAWFTIHAKMIQSIGGSSFRQNPQQIVPLNQFTVWFMQI